MSFPDHPLPVIAASMAPVPNNSGMYTWCSGMNSGVAGETVANEECVCVCVCVHARVCKKWQEQTGKTE